MIDTSNAKWEMDKNLKYAVKWFNERGFDGKLDKMYMSKTKFTVEKDGVTYKFELPTGITNIKGYMDQFEYAFELKREIQRLQEQLGE